MKAGGDKSRKGRTEEEKQRDSLMKQAEMEYHSTIAALEHELNVAQKAYQKSVNGVNKSLGKYKGVTLYEDRIETPEGVASFEAGPVSAQVDTAGNIAVSQRVTLTRLVAGGIVGGLIFPKKKTTDARELYLLIQTPSFASMIECPADKGKKARQFAMLVNNTALSAPKAKVARQQLISQGHEAVQTKAAAKDRGDAEAALKLEAARRLALAPTATVDTAAPLVQAPQTQLREPTDPPVP